MGGADQSHSHSLVSLSDIAPTGRITPSRTKQGRNRKLSRSPSSSSRQHLFSPQACWNGAPPMFLHIMCAHSPCQRCVGCPERHSVPRQASVAYVGCMFLSSYLHACLESNHGRPSRSYDAWYRELLGRKLMRREDRLPLGAEERTILNGGVPERVPIFVEGALSYFGDVRGKISALLCVVAFCTRALGVEKNTRTWQVRMVTRQLRLLFC
jgi:hypothetical protein